jgi:DNA-binding NarL/FixJ family response regulator
VQVDHKRKSGSPERAGRNGNRRAGRRTSVVIADANYTLRTAARAVLERDGDFVVFEAGDADELGATVASKRPHVALVDLDLPPLGGLHALEAMDEPHSTRCVIWVFSPEPERLRTLVWVGPAYGFLPKTVTPDALIRSLRGVADGEACFSRELTGDLIGEVRAFARRERSRRLAANLSSREGQVLALVSDGLTNKQIAGALHISEFTVKRHIHNILAKLDLRSRRGAATVFRDARAPEEAPWALELA